MKAYMAYSREGGSCEGALLIFACTVKEAKPYAWASLSGLCITDEYTDVAVTLIKDSAHLFAQADQAKLRANTPHVVEDPQSCKQCNLWGYKLNEQGYCEDCWSDKLT